MHQANREAVFAWLDACNRKPKAELYLLITVQPRTSHCAAKSVRMHSGLDASSPIWHDAQQVFCELADELDTKKGNVPICIGLYPFLYQDCQSALILSNLL
jgi:hypothetical protein